jgi:hypothetical protein
LFKKVSEIESHLKTFHAVPKFYFHSAKMFLNYAGPNYNLICSICSEVINGKV